MRDSKQQRRQIAQGSLPWGIVNGKRKLVPQCNGMR